VVTPPRAIDNDHLEQGLVWMVCSRFQVNPMIHPIIWPISAWGMKASHQ
jgi:hypothetical protein